MDLQHQFENINTKITIKKENKRVNKLAALLSDYGVSEGDVQIRAAKKIKENKGKQFMPWEFDKEEESGKSLVNYAAEVNQQLEVEKEKKDAEEEAKRLE